MAAISSISSRRLSLAETPCSILRWAIDRRSSPRGRLGATGRSLSSRVEDDGPALAAGLGGHHRDLGAGDELARVGCVLRAEGDPDRERDGPCLVEVRVGHLPRNPFGECVRRLEIADADDDRELLAAGPADVVRLAYDAAELRCELGQHLVADGVPVDVVDPLEVVEIEHQRAPRMTPARWRRERSRCAAARGRSGGSRAR